MSNSPYHKEYPPFISHDRVDDMTGWAEKLEALGQAINALAEESEKHIVLDVYGDQLGNIVSDYAGALRYYLDEARPALVEFFKDAERKADARKHLACAKGGAAT